MIWTTTPGDIVDSSYPHMSKQSSSSSHFCDFLPHMFRHSWNLCITSLHWDLTFMQSYMYLIHNFINWNWIIIYKLVLCMFLLQTLFLPLLCHSSVLGIYVHFSLGTHFRTAWYPWLLYSMKMRSALVESYRSIPRWLFAVDVRIGRLAPPSENAKCNAQNT